MTKMNGQYSLLDLILYLSDVDLLVVGVVYPDFDPDSLLVLFASSSS